ncbi:hypothetical protein PSP6_80101 [Paraburkholderia tropica]|nr:hypothetical protein PSP6_80101 [Paraburkholderia tropica]
MRRAAEPLQELRINQAMKDGEMRGAQKFEGNSYDGETPTCSVGGTPVMLEWDGGTTFDTSRSRMRRLCKPGPERNGLRTASNAPRSRLAPASRGG